MKTLVLVFAASTAVTAFAQQTNLQPANFSHRAAVQLHGPGPFHYVELPLQVYEGIQQADLADLRVINGAGEFVPHALLKENTTKETQVDEKTVPVFPIREQKSTGSDTPNLAIDVRQNRDGTLIALRQTDKKPESTVVAGVIADASKLPKGARSLRLITDGAPTPFHSYSIETSDDLETWRTLRTDAQLVDLLHQGQRIQRNVAEWDGDSGKYLRILWHAPQEAPAIRSISVGIRNTRIHPAPVRWTASVAPIRREQNTFEYAFPIGLPLEQMRIELPDANTVVPLQVQRPVTYSQRSSRQKKVTWQTVTESVAFRLQSGKEEVRSPDIFLGLLHEPRLRLSLDARAGTFGASAPAVRIGFAPHNLVFLSRGEGPFTLLWGAREASNSGLPIQTLIPGYRSWDQTVASRATLETSAMEKQAAPAAVPSVGETPERNLKPVLWGILIAGVLLIGFMVWKLLGQMRTQNEQANS